MPTTHHKHTTWICIIKYYIWQIKGIEKITRSSSVNCESFNSCVWNYHEAPKARYIAQMTDHVVMLLRLDGDFGSSRFVASAFSQSTLPALFLKQWHLCWVACKRAWRRLPKSRWRTRLQSKRHQLSSRSSHALVAQSIPWKHASAWFQQISRTLWSSPLRSTRACEDVRWPKPTASDCSLLRLVARHA